MGTEELFLLGKSELSCPSLKQRIYVLAIKPLYATHYFQTALDLSFRAQGSSTSADEGFYLITVKASRQAGLTGFKRGLIRKVAVRKTRCSAPFVLDAALGVPAGADDEPPEMQ